jgi:WD40 repeat protein
LDDSWDACVGKIDIEYGKCVAFSHKGDRVAACGGKEYSQDQGSNFVVIIDAATGAVLSTFKGHERAVHGIAFSPDDSLLVSGSEDCTVRLWEIQTGVLVRTLRLEDPVRSVEFSHDGSMIACTSGIWDGMLQGVVHKFDERVSRLAWSPNKAEVALGYRNGSIKILNATTWTFRELASVHDKSVCSLTYTREGTRVASCSKHTTVVHGTDAGAVLHNFFTFDVRSVSFSRDGEKLVIARGNSMVIRDLANSVDVAEFKQPKWIYSVSVSPDGMSIAIADGDKLSIWQMNGPIRSSEATSYDSQVSCVAISPNSAFIASGSWGGDVKLWNFATGECLHTFSRFMLNSKRHSGVVSCIAISPDS